MPAKTPGDTEKSKHRVLHFKYLPESGRKTSQPTFYPGLLAECGATWLTVGLSQAFFPHIICWVPCHGSCMLLWLPALPAVPCFVASSLFLLCQLQDSQGSPPLKFRAWWTPERAVRMSGGDVRRWQSLQGRWTLLPSLLKLQLKHQVERCRESLLTNVNPWVWCLEPHSWAWWYMQSGSRPLQPTDQSA